MRRCANCLMAETKPGIELDDDELCQACVHNEMREDVDYDERYRQLEELADTYRSSDGSYDCLIPVSGGKDSHYAVHVATNELDLNPLLVTVKDPYTRTEAGRHNIKNITDAYGCDLVTKEVSRSVNRKMTRIAFEELGYTTWADERAIQVAPIQTAIEMDIPFIIYGENTAWEYGGVLYDHDDEEPYHARDQIDNRVAKTVDDSLWLDNGVSEEDLNLVTYPDEEEIDEAGLEPIFLSYFMPWDGYKHYQIAKRHGLRDLSNEWDRDGYIEDYDQVDTVGYLANVYLKYPKFGFGRATDVVGYWRRSDYVDISLEEGKELIEANDHQLDQRVLEDFLDFTGYSRQEFWEIVESYRNEDLFDDPFTRSDNEGGPKNDFENIDV